MAIDPRLIGFPQIKNINVSDKNLNLILQNMKERIEKYRVAFEQLQQQVISVSTAVDGLSTSQTQQDSRTITNTTVIRETGIQDDFLEGELPPTDDIRYTANDFIPAGVVWDYAGASVPDGWLRCDGTAVSRTTYARLFSAIGTIWGVGDGSTTFNLPDQTDAYRIGAGTDPVGSTVGNTGSTLDLTHEHDEGTLVTANAGSHTHSSSGTTGPTASTVEVQAGTGATVAMDTHVHAYSNTTGSAPAHNHTITGLTGEENAHQASGVGNPVDIRPESRVFTWIIKT